MIPSGGPKMGVLFLLSLTIDRFTATIQGSLCVTDKLCQCAIKERYRIPAQAGRLGIGILEQALLLGPFHCIVVARKAGALSRLIQGAPEEGQKFFIGAGTARGEVRRAGAQGDAGARRPHRSLIEIIALLNIREGLDRSRGHGAAQGPPQEGQRLRTGAGSLRREEAQPGPAGDVAVIGPLYRRGIVAAAGDVRKDGGDGRGGRGGHDGHGRGLGHTVHRGRFALHVQRGAVPHTHAAQLAGQLSQAGGDALLCGTGQADLLRPAGIENHLIALVFAVDHRHAGIGGLIGVEHNPVRGGGNRHGGILAGDGNGQLLGALVLVDHGEVLRGDPQGRAFPAFRRVCPRIHTVPERENIGPIGGHLAVADGGGQVAGVVVDGGVGTADVQDIAVECGLCAAVIPDGDEIRIGQVGHEAIVVGGAPVQVIVRIVVPAGIVARGAPVEVHIAVIIQGEVGVVDVDEVLLVGLITVDPQGQERVARPVVLSRAGPGAFDREKDRLDCILLEVQDRRHHGDKGVLVFQAALAEAA